MGRAFHATAWTRCGVAQHLRRIVIDEIHTLFVDSSFRPMLGSFLWHMTSMFPHTPRYFLSATMTEYSVAQLREQLKADPKDLRIIRQADTSRSNLVFDIRPRHLKPYPTIRAALRVARSVVEHWAVQRPNSEETPQCIVYVERVVDVWALRDLFRDSRVCDLKDPACWVSQSRTDLATSLRKEISDGTQRFETGNRSATVLVATCGYGTGIDNARVSLVVMVGIPHHVEHVAQLAGRAGRRGQSSRVVLVRVPRVRSLEAALEAKGTTHVLSFEDSLAMAGHSFCIREHLQSLLDNRPSTPCGVCEICFSNQSRDVRRTEALSKNSLSRAGASVPDGHLKTDIKKGQADCGRVTPDTYRKLLAFTLPNKGGAEKGCIPCGMLFRDNNHERCKFGMLCYVCYKPAEVRSECGLRRIVEAFNTEHKICSRCGLPWYLPQQFACFEGFHVDSCGGYSNRNRFCNVPEPVARARAFVSVAFWWYRNPVGSPLNARVRLLIGHALPQAIRSKQGIDTGSTASYMAFLAWLLLENSGSNFGDFVEVTSKILSDPGNVSL